MVKREKRDLLIICLKPHSRVSVIDLMEKRKGEKEGLQRPDVAQNA
jgi:hypothetical protein